MRVLRLDPEQWKAFAADAHKIAFGETKDPALDRIDFALLAIRPDDKPGGYMTCREFDAETVYWQYGGAMPGTIGSTSSYIAYLAFVRYAKDHYKRVTTLIENTNTAMLKMAMKVGFRVVGVRCYKGSILLEHLLEFEGT